MRFSTSLVAAGLATTIFAAPVAERQEENDDCVADYTTSSPAGLGRQTTIKTSSVRVSTVPPRPSSASRTPFTFTKTSTSRSRSTTAVIPTSKKSSVVVVVSTDTVVPAEATGAQGAVTTPQASTKASTPASTPKTTAITATTAKTTPTTSKSTTPTSSAATSAATGSLKWIGADESGAEFGNTNIPGVLGTDYTWPNTSAIKILMNKGMNIFRIPILMERIAPGNMTAALDATYLADLTTVVDFITAAGGHAVIDPHNFGRYAGTIFTSTSSFKTFWTNLATPFKSNDNVVFDCNNEFHDEPSNALVASLNQACIDGIRAAGATTQYVFVEGTSYTGAWTWVSSGNGDAMGNLTDASDKIVYEMHQYLDSDGSGTSATCVSSTIGAERVAAATAWLRANNKVGILGEYAGGVNAQCESAVTGMLDALAAASDVWLGAMWWGAGPWWGTYIYGLEPSTGVAYSAYIDLITKYV